MQVVLTCALDVYVHHFEIWDNFHNSLTVVDVRCMHSEAYGNMEALYVTWARLFNRACCVSPPSIGDGPLNLHR
jgi:hypothetical protein